MEKTEWLKKSVPDKKYIERQYRATWTLTKTRTYGLYGSMLLGVQRGTRPQNMLSFMVVAFWVSIACMMAFAVYIWSLACAIIMPICILGCIWGFFYMPQTCYVRDKDKDEKDEPKILVHDS